MPDDGSIIRQQRRAEHERLMQEGLKREMEKAQAAHMQVLNNRKAKNERRRLRMEAYEEQMRRNHHVNIEEPRLVMMKGSQDRGEMEAQGNSGASAPPGQASGQRTSLPRKIDTVDKEQHEILMQQNLMAQHSLAEQAARQKDEQRQREIDAARRRADAYQERTQWLLQQEQQQRQQQQQQQQQQQNPSNDENVEHRKDNAMAPLVAKNTHNADGEDGEGSTALSIIEGEEARWAEVEVREEEKQLKVHPEQERQASKDYIHGLRDVVFLASGVHFGTAGHSVHGQRQRGRKTKKKKKKKKKKRRRKKNEKQPPGPSTYKIRDPESFALRLAANKYSGRFNTSNPKSYVDWAEYYSKSTPGPSEYGTLPAVKIGGGRFNESRPKSYIALVEYTSRQLPGPADYAEDFTKPRKLPGGGRISATSGKSVFDLSSEAASMPSAQSYPPLPGPKIMGGRFSTAFPMSHLDLVMARSAELPSPADYSRLESLPISGGRFNESRPLSTLDWVRKRAKETPSPAAYDTSDFRGGDYVSRPKTSSAGQLATGIMKTSKKRRGRRRKGARLRARPFTRG